MSKQRPSKSVRKTASAAPAGPENSWTRRLFKNTYTRSGRRMKVAGWAVKLQHQGRRHTFSLATPNRAAAAVEAKAI